MAEHPISGLMSTVMQSIKDMVDVNTIVGDAVETPDGNVIIPISRVSFGFAAGGTDFGSEKKAAKEDKPSKCFGGGSGAGVSISPIAFMVVGNGNVRLIPIDSNNPIERLIDLVPDIMDKIYKAVEKKISSKASAEPVNSDI